MNNEQQSNYNKLKFLFVTEKEVHITLNRKTRSGQNYFYNGKIIDIHENGNFILKDRLTTQIYIFTVFDLKDGGVSIFTNDK